MQDDHKEKEEREITLSRDHVTFFGNRQGGDHSTWVLSYQMAKGKCMH